MYKLIQIKKQLTFEEICPYWAKELRRGTASKGLLNNFTQCIVGEAHGFNSDYSYASLNSFCQECFDYSFDFGGKDLSQIDNFVAHWNEKHVKLP